MIALTSPSSRRFHRVSMVVLYLEHMFPVNFQHNLLQLPHALTELTQNAVSLHGYV